MSRRPVNPSRRHSDGGGLPFLGSIHSKSRSSPLLSIGLLVVVCFFAIVISCIFVSLYYQFLTIISSTTGRAISEREALSKIEESATSLLFENLKYLSAGGVSCTLEVHRAIPVLKKAYGDSMRKVLHVGPETCSVVSKLLKEEDTEAWGVEPYDLDDADGNCKSLVRKGIVRVADIKFPLPYRPKSFSLVIVSDAVDYLSPKYLNKTLPELARVSADGVVIFAGYLAEYPELVLPGGYPGQHRAKVAELSKFGRPAKLRSSSWWIRYFLQNSLEENEAAVKKFEQASVKMSYKPACQIFHLKSYH
ncbi:hypothetical protein EZV62_011005 [Acer yangbiense]|uniref:Methyltransferase type 11 domain-containing protein n=1 Tax=Acer yangbiense TaxID=1000413 RepID=A0A5C7I449_9ROSI|nr:hypothetical protein EZV62_011005 [Acer yangbiense]